MRKRGFLTLASKKSLLRRRLGFGAIMLMAAVFVSGVAFAFDTDGHMGIEGVAEVVFWPEMTWNNTPTGFNATSEESEADRVTEEAESATSADGNTEETAADAAATDYVSTSDEGS